MYGNIGSDTRLDFTVIGPAVNLTARIESMCRQLGRPLLLSSDFVKAGGIAAQSARHLLAQGRRCRSGDLRADAGIAPVARYCVLALSLLGASRLSSLRLGRGRRLRSRILLGFPGLELLEQRFLVGIAT